MTFSTISFVQCYDICIHNMFRVIVTGYGWIFNNIKTTAEYLLKPRFMGKYDFQSLQSSIKMIHHWLSFCYNMGPNHSNRH